VHSVVVELGCTRAGADFHLLVHRFAPSSGSIFRASKGIPMTRRRLALSLWLAASLRRMLE